MSTRCGLCGAPSTRDELAEVDWLAPAIIDALVRAHPGWRRRDGACPACVQHALLHALLEGGDPALQAGLQSVWPLNAEDAFGALPTPLRMHADPRFTGRGVTLALIDTDFYPHPDLTRPSNRIRAWVDVADGAVEVRLFTPEDTPRWPGWDRIAPAQWHGLMTSAVAAGNGALSHGFYAGMAPDADLVLVKARHDSGAIGNDRLVRALDWVRAHAVALGIRLVNVSLGGEADAVLADHPVDRAVAGLVAAGVVVIVAAGNDGVRRLVPPATAPAALTVGGLDDRNTFERAARALWHSNYGETAGCVPKPELVAPSIWVVAPLLPDTESAAEARRLFERRARNDRSVETRIAEAKLITPHYQHVDGTSFAAPIVAGAAACMLEANPSLGPRRVRDLLVAAAEWVPGVAGERQGAGALDAGRAVALALADRHGPHADFGASPVVGDGAVRFLLHDHRAREVRVLGSWDGWAAPGLAARRLEPGLWSAELRGLEPGPYAYKFLLDGTRWLADPANPSRQRDGHGGFNSLFTLASAGAGAVAAPDPLQRRHP